MKGNGRGERKERKSRDVEEKKARWATSQCKRDCLRFRACRGIRRGVSPRRSLWAVSDAVPIIIEGRRTASERAVTAHVATIAACTLLEQQARQCVHVYAVFEKTASHNAPRAGLIFDTGAEHVGHHDRGQALHVQSVADADWPAESIATNDLTPGPSFAKSIGVHCPSAVVDIVLTTESLQIRMLVANGVAHVSSSKGHTHYEYRCAS